MASEPVFSGPIKKLSARQWVKNHVREVLSKAAYQDRVRRIVHSKASQKVGSNIAKGLRQVCKEVIDGGGVATKG